MKRIFAVFAMFAALSLVAPAQTTHSSASLMQVVTAAPPIAATFTFTSNGTPTTVSGVTAYTSPVGKPITYSGTVTGSNNGASPTGTVTVVGITGTQTVTIGANGAYTCSETVTTPNSGFKVVATYNGDVNFF